MDATSLPPQAGLKLMLVNGCARLEQAAGLHAASAPALVATSEYVGDGLALSFAVHFYRGLAGGASIGAAFGEAQDALRAEVHAEQAELDSSLRIPSAGEEAKGLRLFHMPGQLLVQLPLKQWGKKPEQRRYHQNGNTGQRRRIPGLR